MYCTRESKLCELVSIVLYLLYQVEVLSPQVSRYSCVVSIRAVRKDLSLPSTMKLLKLDTLSNMQCFGDEYTLKRCKYSVLRTNMY